MSFKPDSLAQLFTPPKDQRGIFGWICGYSADAGFIEDALERFSELSSHQRAHQGQVLFALMLDPGNPQISFGTAPGALHLPVKTATLPFALLHAKVAMLAFGGDGQRTLRLIVSTGNWTRQTLEESLDLAWCIDVNEGEQDASAEEIRQCRTDMAAAWEFLSFLHQHFDLRPLEWSGADGNGPAALALKFEDWVRALARPHRDHRPRFFDSRAASLAKQLPALIKRHASDVSRNYLAFGSGFFGGEGSKGEFVPDQVLAALQDAGLATATCDQVLIVNPRGCQAVASRQQAIEDAGWTIYAAGVPSYFGAAPRTLHAKFIFGTKGRDDSNKCSSPWLYLGSGNLTNSGFMNRAGPDGNLEAGVVLVPSGLTWEQEGRKDNGAAVVTNRLPIDLDVEDAELPTLSAGQGMPERVPAFLAPPISILLWVEDTGRARLVPQGELAGTFDLLDPAGHPCAALGDGSFAWPASRPREVTVTWLRDGNTNRALVPVIDNYGRCGAIALPALDIDDAWDQLASFPLPPDTDDLPEDDPLHTDGEGAAGQSVGRSSATYPIRRMMLLVEEIAAKQLTIAEADWSAWCNRLGQVLVQAKDAEAVKVFRSLNLNPLCPLFEPAFRPSYSADPQREQGARYEAALTAAAQEWQVAGLSRLGGR